VVDHTHAGEAGSIETTGGRLVVQCGAGRVEALEVQLEGKRRTAAAELLRGLRYERALKVV
jgi:methionyl-tRNA formyltransferase